MTKIKFYSVDEAKAIVENDEVLKSYAAKLRKEDQDSFLDYGNDYFDLCTNVDCENENRVWISLYRDQGIQLEHFDDCDEDCYYVTGLSIEQAILIGRDILNAVKS